VTARRRSARPRTPTPGLGQRVAPRTTTEAAVPTTLIRWWCKQPSAWAPDRRARPVDDGRGRGRHPRPDHGGPRHDDRQRCARHAGQGPECSARHGPVAVDRVPAVAGGGDPAFGLGDRALWLEADLDRLDRAVRDRIGAVRTRDLGRRADRLPCPSGSRRRHGRAGWVHARGAERRASACRTSARADRRADPAGADLRTDHRRPDRRQRRVGVDLPGQPADRRRGDRRRRPHAPPRRRARRRRSTRLARRRAPVSRPGWDRLRALRDRDARRLR
jgi:hypothetical protein